MNKKEKGTLSRFIFLLVGEAQNGLLQQIHPSVTRSTRTKFLPLKVNGKECK